MSSKPVVSNFSTNLASVSKATVAAAKRAARAKQAAFLRAIHNDAFSFDEVDTAINSAKRGTYSADIPLDEKVDAMLATALGELAVEVKESMDEELRKTR